MKHRLEPKLLLNLYPQSCLTVAVALSFCQGSIAVCLWRFILASKLAGQEENG